MKRNTHTTMAAFAIALGTAAPAHAADHVDSPAAVNEPSADITDVFAWMTPDAGSLNLVMNVSPFAGVDSTFAPGVTYAFHVNSSTAYGAAQTETQVICRFYDVARIECWADGEYVEGNPGNSAGLVSPSGRMRVFAGPRNDPFFFEFGGFTETVSLVVAAAGGLTFDADGCPDLDQATADALVGQLQSGPNGAAASDFFAGANVLALVVQIDKSVVNGGGPILGVWGSTHR